MTPPTTSDPEGSKAEGSALGHLRVVYGILTFILAAVTILVLVRFPYLPLGISLPLFCVGVLLPIVFTIFPRILSALCGRRAQTRGIRALLLVGLLFPFWNYSRVGVVPREGLLLSALEIAYSIVLWLLLDRAIELQRDPTFFASLADGGGPIIVGGEDRGAAGDWSGWGSAKGGGWSWGNDGDGGGDSGDSGGDGGGGGGDGGGGD